MLLQLPLHSCQPNLHSPLPHPLHRRYPVSRTLRLHGHLNNHQNPENQTSPVIHETHELNSRNHNYNSSALLLHRLSHASSQSPQNVEPCLPEEEKAKILELSLVRKRTPQFPGSIYVQSPGDPDVSSSLPPLKTLFQGKGGDESGDDDRKMIMRALEIRRTVTEEIFKESMRRGKFGITYTNNLIGRLPDFIDFVMIEAAALKRSPEFSQSSFNVRAKTIIQNSNVVPLVRWFKHNSMSYPQIGKVISMSKEKLDSIRRLAEWLKSIHVKGKLLGVALTKSGGNIFERSNEELDEIVEYLESNGVRRDWMGFVMSRCPQLLSFTIEEVKYRVEFYLDMGINEKDFGTMIFDYPKALGYYSLEEMKQKVDYLKEFGLSTEEVGRLLAFKPQLMGCSIEERWKPLVKYLYYHGISRDGMRKILVTKPMVFCINLETAIAPKVQFFKDIGVRPDGISNMLVKFPPLLTYSLYKKIRPVVIFLMTKAGVREKDIGKVIALGPELLGSSIVHKLEANVKYYLSLGINIKQLGQMIADFPMLLRYNIDVLRPKYSYLRRTMVRPLKDLVDFPRFFSYSLDGRIIPRHNVLVENRIYFTLQLMLSISDEEFEERVAAIVEERKRLESGNVDNYLSVSETDLPNE